MKNMQSHVCENLYSKILTFTVFKLKSPSVGQVIPELIGTHQAHAKGTIFDFYGFVKNPFYNVCAFDVCVQRESIGQGGSTAVSHIFARQNLASAVQFEGYQR